MNSDRQRSRSLLDRLGAVVSRRHPGAAGAVPAKEPADLREEVQPAPPDEGSVPSEVVARSRAGRPGAPVDLARVRLVEPLPLAQRTMVLTRSAGRTRAARLPVSGSTARSLRVAALVLLVLACVALVVVALAKGGAAERPALGAPSVSNASRSLAVAAGRQVLTATAR